MRVLHVTHLYAPAIGGAERYIADLSAELVRRGHRVDVITTRATDYLTWNGDLPASEHLDGVQVRRFRSLRRRRYTWELLRYGLDHYWPTRRRSLEPFIFMGNGPFAPAFFTAVWQAAGYYDLVHINALHYAHAWLAFVAARLRGIPIVVTPHLHAAQPETWDVGYMRRILAESDLVLAVTPAEQAFLLTQGLSRRVVVGGNGLRLDRFPPLDPHAARARFGLPQDAFVVLFLGRKTAYKGLGALLAAYRALRSQHPRAYLLAIGPETPDSQRLWTEAGDSPGLVVRGAVLDEERLAALAACDVLALPSRAEAFGIVYLEAWAYRKPVIGAALPAVASLVGDGEDGFLVDPDHPAQLHSRLLWLADHPDQAAAMGERGHAKLAARYTVEAIGAIVEAAYIRVLRHHRLSVEERPRMLVNLIGALEPFAAQHALAWQRRFFARRGHTVTVCTPTASGVLPSADLYIYHYPDSGPLLDTLPALDRGVAILDCRQPLPGVLADPAFVRLVTLADLVVVPTQTDAAALAGLIDPTAVHVVAPAVSLTEFSPGPADPTLLQQQGWLDRTVILAAGADDQSPVNDLLAAVLERVRDYIPHATLAMLPATADRKALYRLAAVYLTYPGDPAASLYALEAMACGTPIVGVADSALAPLLDAAGLAALPDDPDDLAAKIVQLLAADDLYTAHVQRSLACASAHSQAHYDLQWSALLAAASAWLPNRPTLLSSTSAVVPPAPVAPEPAGWSPGPTLARLKSAAAVTLKDYRVRSAVPYAGPLIVWVRRNLTSHLREPYLDPVLQRQEAFNWQAAQAVEELARQLAALEHASDEAAAVHAELDSRLAGLAAELTALTEQSDPPDADAWAALHAQLEQARSLLARLQPPD